MDDQKLGELSGQVAGLTTAFSAMQIAQESNRKEVIDIFREMRNDVKDLAAATKTSADKLADSMSMHIKETIITKNDVANILEWRKNVGATIDTLWDERNNAKGMFSASRLISGALWSTLAVCVGFFLQWHYK